MNLFIRFLNIKPIRQILTVMNLSCRAWYDGKRFLRYGPNADHNEPRQMVSGFMLSYHCIEKGLTLRNARPGFGRSNVLSLCESLKRTVSVDDPADMHQWMSAREVLKTYVEWHESLGKTDPDTERCLECIKEFLEEYQKPYAYAGDDVGGGNREVLRDLYMVAAAGNFEQLLSIRRSIRNFADKAVNLDDIYDAVRLAQKSPSACNRQPSHIYILQDKERISSILGMQNGAHGFLEDIPVLLVVAGDVRVYQTTAERNSVYLETGLFAMSLMYALTYKGLGTCPLHWCVTLKTDRVLRKVCGLNDAHVPSMLIAVGHIPERLQVAHSERFPLNSIVTSVK